MVKIGRGSRRTRTTAEATGSKHEGNVDDPATQRAQEQFRSRLRNAPFEMKDLTLNGRKLRGSDKKLLGKDQAKVTDPR